MIYLIVALYNIALSMVMLLFPLHVSNLGLAAEILGLLTAVPGVLLLLLRIPGGFLSDYLGEKKVLLLSMVAMALGASLLRFFSAVMWLVLAQIGIGISRAVFWPAGQSYVSRLEEGGLNRRLGYFSLAASIGGVTGTLLAGMVLRQIGYRFAFVGVAALAGITALTLVFFVRSLARRAAEPSISYLHLADQLVDMVRQPGLYLAGFVSFFAAVPIAVLSSFYPVYLARIGYRPEVIGVLSSFRGGAASVASLLAGGLISHIGAKRTMLAALAASGLGLLIAPLTTQMLVLALSISLIGAASGLLLIVSMSLVACFTVEERRGLAMAYVGTFFSMALFLVPIFMGWLTAALSLDHAFAGGGVIVLSCAGLGRYLWQKIYSIGGGNSKAMLKACR